MLCADCKAAPKCKRSLFIMYGHESMSKKNKCDIKNIM